MNYCEAQKRATELNKTSPVRDKYHYAVEMSNYELLDYEVWRYPLNIEHPILVVNSCGRSVRDGY